MTLAVDRKPMTVEEFMTRRDARDYELIDGFLVERKDMGTRSAYIAGNILSTFFLFDPAHKIGWPFNADAVYQCFGSNRTGRKMDASFVCRGRLPDERIPDGHMFIAPDLTVEVVSPNDLAYEVEEKVSQYLAAGVSLVWIVYPETRSIEVKRPDGSATRFREDQEISGESIIPGYKARVGDFFPPIENVEPAEDAVR